MTELAEIFAGWPLAASVAALLAGWRSGRRRSALNEALHEVRRPLQSLVLAAGSNAAPSVVEGSAQLAGAALARLDREINGGGVGAAVEPVAGRPLLESAVRRWKSRAALAGGSLDLRWSAADAVLCGDRVSLAQAIDNLIVNAIEHGGPRIAVEATLQAGRLQVAVIDSGRGSRPAVRRETPAELLARLAGRRRRGHGLAVVRQVARAHGGCFTFRRAARGSRAVLDLPLERAGVESA